jgi:hypothetical protein
MGAEMIWCCVTMERQLKTERLAKALAAGCGGRVCFGAPPDDNNEFIVWGQVWLAAKIIPEAVERGRGWWQIDNGYYKPAKGTIDGYYTLNYNSLGPKLLPNPDMSRLARPMPAWRSADDRRSGYVLIALPGLGYGTMFGLSMADWSTTIRSEVEQHTTREILVREKDNKRKLEDDLAGAWCVVTHSSKVACDAVFAGVPAIVAPTNPAAPVCSTDLADIESLPMPDREKWWASLMCQQFTIPEMRTGVAKRWMDAIREVEADEQKRRTTPGRRRPRISSRGPV